MSRYATVVPGVVGCGTYALVTPIDEAAPAAVHPASATAASSTALAGPARDVSLRIAPGYRAVLVRRQPRSTAVPSRPSGGEPMSIRALWKRCSVKPVPQSFLARSRSLRISSLPQVYRP